MDPRKLLGKKKHEEEKEKEKGNGGEEDTTQDINKKKGFARLKNKGVQKVQQRQYRVSGPLGPVQHRVLVNSQLEWNNKKEFKLVKPPIGKGAFGTVYKASHVSGFQLAIKVVNFTSVIKGKSFSLLHFIASPPPNKKSQ